MVATPDPRKMCVGNSIPPVSPAVTPIVSRGYGYSPNRAARSSSALACRVASAVGSPAAPSATPTTISVRPPWALTRPRRIGATVAAQSRTARAVNRVVGAPPALAGAAVSAPVPPEVPVPPPEATSSPVASVVYPAGATTVTSQSATSLAATSALRLVAGLVCQPSRRIQDRTGIADPRRTARPAVATRSLTAPGTVRRNSSRASTGWPAGNVPGRIQMVPGRPATAPPASYRPVTGWPPSCEAVMSSRPPARPMRGALGHSRKTSRSVSPSGTNRTATSPVTSRFPGSTVRWTVYRGRSAHGSGYPAGTSHGVAPGAEAGPAAVVEGVGAVVVDSGAPVVVTAGAVVVGAASRSSPAQPAARRRRTAVAATLRTP